MGTENCDHYFLNNLIELKNSIKSEVLDRTDILSQVFHYNTQLKIGKKCITQNLEGIQTISDIFDQTTNRFLTYDQIKTNFPISILTFNQIISCIKKNWKSLLKSGAPIHIIKVPYFKGPKVIPVEKWTSQAIY